MLIRFGVSNHSSIREYQELSLVASSLKDVEAALLRSSAIKESVVPAALIYGANASGKSNVLAAFAAMRDSVRHSHANLTPSEQIPRDPFKLDHASEKSPTRYDCDFVVGESRYHYGFIFDSDEFTSEWLYAFVSGSRQLWFHRKKGEPIVFGKYLRGQNRSIASLTRRNSLFLSAAAQNAHLQLSPIYNFFDGCLSFHLSTLASAADVTARLSQGDVDPRIVDFLRIADFGIDNVVVEQRKAKAPRETEFSRALDQLIKAHALSIGLDFEAEKEKMKIVRFTHSGENGLKRPMALSDESQGTLRLVSLLSPALQALDKGHVLLVDELDASLHTLLAQRFVSLFCSSSINRHGAQLIATTHDTNLLCAGSLRRDQIWFTEKDKAGTTHLYPLTDISTRKTDNLEKGYIQGRFGAVPFVGRVDQLFERDHKNAE